MSFLKRFFSSTSSPAMEAATTKAKSLVADNKVMVFSKSYCPYCKATKQTLSSLDATYTAIELDQEPDGAAIQAALKEMTGQTSVPNIFIGEEHIGGNSDLQGLKDLKHKLASVGAL